MDDDSDLKKYDQEQLYFFYNFILQTVGDRNLMHKFCDPVL